jgi:hypothetical protein
MVDLDNSLHYESAKSVKGYDDTAALHMQKKAQHRLLQFLLARFFLLHLLLEEAKKCGGVHPANHRLLWVLLQAQPIEILGGDAFKELAEALRTLSIEALKKLIKNRYSQLSHIFEEVNDPTTGQSKRRPLYCFLDDIQITATYRMGEFFGDDKKTQRPFLRSIWSTLTGVLQPTEMLVILSGTAIDSRSLQDVLDSSVFKPTPYKIRRDIGAFDDADAQRQYIERYLPDKQSVAWEAFLTRAWGWCRGRLFRESSCRIDSYHSIFRYRTTAILIQLMLEFGPHSPHSILEKFVNKSTGFMPTDGEQLSLNEPQLDNFDLDNFQLWKFERLGA